MSSWLSDRRGGILQKEIHYLWLCFFHQSRPLQLSWCTLLGRFYPPQKTQRRLCLSIFSMWVCALRSLQKRISVHTCGLSQTLSNKEQRSTKRDLYCNKCLFTGKHESVPGGQMRGWRVWSSVFVSPTYSTGERLACEMLGSALNLHLLATWWIETISARWLCCWAAFQGIRSRHRLQPCQLSPFCVLFSRNRSALYSAASAYSSVTVEHFIWISKLFIAQFWLCW